MHRTAVSAVAACNRNRNHSINRNPAAAAAAPTPEAVAATVAATAAAADAASAAEHEDVGIVQLARDAIARCAPELQHTLWSNIVLAGGCTMFPGFDWRFERDLRALTPAGSSPSVRGASANRTFASWIGGSLLAQLSNFDSSFCMSKAEFAECGSGAIHRRCGF